MIGVITGDIINSRVNSNQDVWLEPLKSLFKKSGKQTATWEIYRGDSFQLEISDAKNALIEALKIKCCIKGVEKHCDVRMGIGIGDKTYAAKKITESNGTAFINSGEAFAKTNRNKKNIEIVTPWVDLDDEVKLMMNMALIIMDRWTVNTAKVIATSIEYRKLKQSEIAEKLGIKSQPEISQIRKRGGYEEIMAMEDFFRKNVEKHQAIP